MLGPFSITAMGVGAIIGAGIFVLTRTAAALYAGPRSRSPLCLRHRLRSRVPWVPWLPMLGVVFCLGLLAGLGVYAWVRLGIWIAIGLVICFHYGRFQSRLRTM